MNDDVCILALKTAVELKNKIMKISEIFAFYLFYSFKYIAL